MPGIEICNAHNVCQLAESEARIDVYLLSSPIIHLSLLPMRARCGRMGRPLSRVAVPFSAGCGVQMRSNPAVGGANKFRRGGGEFGSAKSSV